MLAWLLIPYLLSSYQLELNEDFTVFKLDQSQICTDNDTDSGNGDCTNFKIIS